MPHSDSIIAIYQDVYDVVIPDLDYYLRQIDCRDGCPVNTDPRGYMLALHAGNFLEGYKKSLLGAHYVFDTIEFNGKMLKQHPKS